MRFLPCLLAAVLAVPAFAFAQTPAAGSPAPAAAPAARPAPAPVPEHIRALEQQVMATERAFADTMKVRDHDKFGSFLAEDVIFYGGERAQRGKAAVMAGWKGFYTGPQAPFSWDPDHVEVVAGGTMAYSSGPVRDPSGKIVSRFNSVWRLEAPGVWKVLFDKGSPVCDCANKG
ncbi:MAG TPA: nuclear transport factor 2 family protein [Burkholderiaceae bacterium]